ncbi:MAG: hypothetical protein LBR23_09140 [Spirochaetaceae bacterium]|jgi:hypothetical protein|nr:hypothetical protein [Spirochaetaceae bacterium]
MCCFRNVKPLFLAPLFLLCALGFAQTPPEANPKPEEPPILGEDEFVFRANQRGDQWIKIDLAVDLPVKPDMTHLKPGGMGALGYQRFLNPYFAVGGDIGFAYNVTIGENIFTMLPLMVKGTVQPVFRKFEFPITAGVGVAFEKYLDKTYAGLALRGEAGVFWRIITDWSFGLHYGIYILPQEDYLGIIQDVGLSGRYHF